jgi:hypothetical protein
MAEPITIAVITGLVTLMTAYMQHRTEMAKLEQDKPDPPKTEKAKKGEQVAQVVEQGIQKYGNAEEKATLPLYQANPGRFESAMHDMVRELAQREPSFAQQLQDVAKQTNVAQTGGIHGEAHVTGDNYGQNTGVNTGTQTQTFGEWPPKKRDT